ncbi:MAG: TIM-barrel domain-containing protein [Bacteroidales bacterium]
MKTNTKFTTAKLLLCIFTFLPLWNIVIGQNDKKENHVVWNEILNGVWKTKINNVPSFNLLSISNGKIRTNAINDMGEAKFPIDKSEIHSFTRNGKTFIRFPLAKGEEIYGLGLNFHHVKERGRIFRLHMDHYGGTDNGRTHAPVPFLVSSEGYGIFINAARYIDVNVGAAVSKDSKHPAIPKDRNTASDWTVMPYSDNLEFTIPEEGVEVIVFSGKNMMEVVQRFNLYCGGGVIPAKWGLGFMQRLKTLATEDDVKQEVKQFKENHFPLNMVGLEPGWHSKAYPCSFEWDKTRFPNPAELSKELKKDGYYLNLWFNPYLWPGSAIDKAVEPFVGDYTVWCGNVPDFTIPKAREAFKNFIKKHQVDIGISGFKADEVDGYDEWLWPDMATFPSGKSGEQMRQTFPNQVASAVDEVYREKNERTYGLVRGGQAGGVNLPFVIYSDYYSHRGFITALVNSGFCGVLWTPEARNSETAEEWVRRIQTACFSPMAMINAWQSGTKPWDFKEVYPYVQDVAFLRMRLLPYIYSTFSEYYFKGTPPFRAVNLEPSFTDQIGVIKTKLDDTKNPYKKDIVKDITDQYMMGNHILVAPFFAGDTTRQVVLPKGNWYDFYTGEYAGNGEIITIKATLDKIPLFVKDGSLIPMMPPVENTRDWKKNTPLEVRHYGTAEGVFYLYDDDGTSYDYEKGDYTIKELRYKKNKGSVKTIKKSPYWTYGKITWKQM